MAKREHISILNISIFAFYNREVSKSQKNMETFSLFEVGMAKWVNIVAFRDLLAQRGSYRNQKWISKMLNRKIDIMRKGALLEPISGVGIGFCT